MKPVDDLNYWAQRLAQATELHHAVFVTSRDRWAKILQAVEDTTHEHFLPGQRLLDAGCGYGSAASRMPQWVHYTGVDFSPELITEARCQNPEYVFVLADLRKLTFEDDAFDWGFLMSVRGMIKANLGLDVWQQMERELLRVCWRLLVMEYDGSYEVVERCNEND